MRRALSLALLLAGCAAEGGPRLGGCGGPVRVVNEARLAVEQLYLREPGQTGWGVDRLAPGELPPGAAYEGRVAASPIALRAVFVDGTATEVARIDTCGAPEIRLVPGPPARR
jgi:hypothetical protein